LAEAGIAAAREAAERAALFATETGEQRPRKSDNVIVALGRSIQ